MNRREKQPEVVVITGATAGVGRATAREFAKAGARIGLLARGEEGLEATKREVEDLGGTAVTVPTDVADAEQVEAAADRVESMLGPLDVWVNNAMTSVLGEVKDLQPDEVRRVTEVNYLGSVYGTLAALRRMMPRDQGAIVQVGSALAYRGIPLQAPYCGSKHAMRGFTDSLRCELLHQGSNVHLTMVHLPAMNTTQFKWVKSKLPRKSQPVPPIYQPEVAAEAIFWAAHHRRREVLVGAPTVVVVNGNKLAPSLGDHYLARNGYEGQMTDELEPPNRPNNLWDPVPGDHGAHGGFGDRSRGSSWQLWANQHRGLLAVAGSAVAGLICAGVISSLNGGDAASFRERLGVGR